MPGPGSRTKVSAKPKNAKRTISRLISYMGAYKALFLVVLVAVLASAGATVIGDSMLRPAIDDYIIPLYERWTAGEVIAAADFIPFLKLVGIMALVFAFGALASWVNARLMLYISTNTLYRIRTDLFDEMEVLPLKYFDGHTHGSLMSLFTNDIDTLRDMMSQSIPNLFSSVITVASVFVMMIITSPLLTLIMVVTMIMMMAFAGAIAKRSAKAFREQQDAIGAVNGYVEEMTSGQKVVKVFNREKKSIEEFNKLNDRLCEAGTRANTLANILMPIMGNMSHIQYAFVAIVGAIRVIGGHMGLGSIAVFLQYTRNFSRPITMMSQQINGILNALAGAERIFAAIDEKNEVDEGKVLLVNASETLPEASSDNRSHLVQAFANTGEWAWRVPSGLSVDDSENAESFADSEDFKLVKLRGDVVFKNVSFSYVPEKEVLHSIELHAEPGQKIALVGSTGSGKTTITNLLTRFYDIDDDKGVITYDGIPIKEISKGALRKSLGMVLQDTHLFTGSIRDNIKYGNLEASEAQIVAAAKLANAHSFITHLEKLIHAFNLYIYFLLFRFQFLIYHLYQLIPKI